MKIAMIIDAWEPILGGGQIHVYNLCKKLIERHNCQIDLFVRSLKNENGEIFNKDEKLLGGNFRVFRCGRPEAFFNFKERVFSIFSISNRLIQENKTQKYDLIHSHSFLGLVSGKIASQKLGLPFVGTLHGANLMDKGEKSFYYFVEKYLLTKMRYNTLITVGSSFLKYPNKNKNIVVIPNGLNPEDFEKIEAAPLTDKFKVTFVGRFEWTKGVDILLEAIRLLKEKKGCLLNQKKLQLNLIGYGYEIEKYQKMVEEYGIGDYVIFRGKIVGDELVKEYKTSNLFVLPSRTEGFGMTIIEAMISKVPVISTRCGGPEDIIQDKVNGFLVDKEDPSQLADILEKILDNKVENLEEIIKNGYNTVLEKFTWDRVSDMTVNEYRKLI